MANTTSAAGTGGPLERLDDWDEFLKTRYPAEGSGKKKEEFRDHRADVRPSVREFYRLNHLHQTLDFVRAKVTGLTTSRPCRPRPFPADRSAGQD